MRLSNNFSLSEFDCHDGSEMPLNIVKNVTLVAEQLQILRNFIGKPITINSGYRSPSYNKRIGGVSKSMHLQGLAADIRVDGISPRSLNGIIEELIKDGRMKQGGLGRYSTFTHYDLGYNGKKRRWYNQE